MASDCADGQSCSGGYCVSSPEVSCMMPSASPDAGVNNSGGNGNGNGNGNGSAMPDAGVDAPAEPQGLITLKVDGRGHVELDGVGTCDSDPPQNGQCQFTVPLAATVTMRAHPSNDWRFERWTTSACPDEDDDRCTFVPAVTMELGAKFRKDD